MVDPGEEFGRFSKTREVNMNKHRREEMMAVKVDFLCAYELL